MDYFDSQVPSSVPCPVQTVSRPLTEKQAGTSKGIFGLLKGWTIDSQVISDERESLIMAIFFAHTCAIVELLKGSPAS